VSTVGSLFMGWNRHCRAACSDLLLRHLGLAVQFISIWTDSGGPSGISWFATPWFSEAQSYLVIT
jgi:hypothetical protein